MQLHPLAEATGYLGSVLGVGMVVPQIVRTYRHRTMPGVSGLSWALMALACFGWLLYGVRTGEIPQIPGNVLLVSGAVLLVLVVPSAYPVGTRAAGLVGGGSALVAAAWTLPAAALGLVAFGIGLVSAIPQTVTSLGRRRGESAVSLLTWVLRVASQGCWFFYAVVLHDRVVTISAAFLLLNALVILVAERVRRAVPAPAPALATTP
jgi:uncharacterized protein with PQ loop repeat